MKKKGQTNAALALSVANVEPNSLVDMTLLGEYTLQKYEVYFKKVNGDNDTAVKLLKEDVDKVFGTTYINGKKEYSMFPIEKLYNLPEDSIPFIHQDVSDQLSKRLTGTKALYDSGKVDFYWEVNPSIDLETATSAKNKIKELDNYTIPKRKEGEEFNPKQLQKEKLIRDKEMLSARETLKMFSNQGPPKITQHFRDGHVKQYEVMLQSDPSLGTSPSGGSNRPISGYYNIALRAGKSVTPIVLADPNLGNARFKPNKNKITEKYMSLIGVVNHEKSISNMIKERPELALRGFYGI